MRTLVALQDDETGFFALKSAEWEEYSSIFKVAAKATEWAFERIREAFEKVAEYEAGRLSIVRRIMLKSTDYLRRIIAPAGFLLEDFVWWVSAG